MVTTQAPLLCPFSGAITVGLLPCDICVFQRPYKRGTLHAPPLCLCSVIPLLNRSSKKSSRLTSIASG